jgi:hypothetical protein
MMAPEYLWGSHSALWRYAPGRREPGESADPFRPDRPPVPHPEPFPWPTEPDWTRPVGIEHRTAASGNGHRPRGA